VIDSLERTIKKKKYSNIETKEMMHLFDSKIEKDLYLFSFYGVIENLIFLDWVVQSYSSISIRKMHTNVINTLRLSVFQIFFSDNISDSTIVYESVELIKKSVIKSSGFVNGILRNIIRNKSKILEDLEALPLIDRLSIKYSFPTAFVEKLIVQMGEKEAELFCVASNKKPEMIVRTNCAKTTRDRLIQELRLENWVVDKTRLSDDGIIIKNPNRIESMAAYKNGLITPQDESSMLVTQILAPDKHMSIIDMCCAPGGKCLHVAERIHPSGKIVGCDIYDHKLKLVRDNKKRLGLENIELRIQDATVLVPSERMEFDVCIADVPCSNTGILRRKPEIKYKKETVETSALIPLQKEILNNGSKYIKLGGALIYSTCSIFEDENIDVVTSFLEKNPAFRLKTFSLNNKTYPGYIQLMPHKDDTDGFFIAYLERIAM